MKEIKTGIILFSMLFVITAVLYPAAVTIIAQTAFPFQASGSMLIDKSGRIYGSALIGQDFTGPGYFVGRPSATAERPYNAAASGGSNLGPANPLLLAGIEERIRFLDEHGIKGPYPSDLVTASASGLDPHISLDSALIQVPAVAKARNMSETDLRTVVLSHKEQVCLPYCQEYVNLLLLNRDLDARSKGE